MTLTEIVLLCLVLGLYVVNLGRKPEATREVVKEPLEIPEAAKRVEARPVNIQRLKDTSYWLEKFRAEQDSWLANILIRRAFIESPGDAEVFKTYVSYLLARTDSAENKTAKMDFLTDGYSAVIAFSEVCSRADFSLVGAFRRKIEEKRAQINLQQESAITSQNDEVLRNLKSVLASVQGCTEASQIRTYLEHAATVELGLNLSALNEKQKAVYGELKRSYENYAVRTAEQLKQAQLTGYNQQAVQRIKTFHEAFVASEKSIIDKLWSKEKPDAVRLVREHIASINMSYLWPEVVTYFNFVYGYVFVKLEDPDKFRVTEVMTLSKKDVMNIL